MNLESYVCGHWHGGGGQGAAMRDATTGEIIATASSGGIDFSAVLEHARDVGGPALRALTFHQRAGMLRALAKKLAEIKEEIYALSFRTGATRSDAFIDIDGGIGTVFAFAGKGARELPNSQVYLDGDVEGLSKGGSFVGQHVYVSREGAAVHINAFNFPVWGMLEKLAPTLLAGMPAIVKPATATAYLTELVVRRMIETGILPPGVLQLVCGSLGDLFEHLNCQDTVSFTGSAHTAERLRTHPNLIRHSVRFIAETDSLNSSILGLDAGPGTPEFELFVAEVAREMTVKAGQKCTAIRKALVPAAVSGEVVAALQATLAKIVVGDPRAEGVRMGPLVSQEQRTDVLDRVAELHQEAEIVCGDLAHFAVKDADREHGAFVPPLLLLCNDPKGARAIHEVEAFGPVATVLPYKGTRDAIALARRSAGSLAASVFSADDAIARELVLGLAPYHGRILVVNRNCAKESTGHGSPLAPLIHGGPGRAGGGEEMGGIRGVLHYMQRTAVQGSPDTITAVGCRWVRGSRLLDPGRHPFRIPFNELKLGDTLKSKEREVTVVDIEQFAALSGDNFYAHMSETEAARNPLFGGRVAHGYFLISAAAGLFVDPDYGPVLGNYGLDELRFVKPVKPGDKIKVRLTCARKSLRADKGWGEVAWDTEITNQNNETVASYNVLTMVSIHAVPDAAGNN
ncbi:MAG TPA: phenylacetic acid degradation bifunctional protein PaaZ [Steroidobacteraceae bacterium]|jgi:oxepin-CoA hydrolase/3-oxo-5,6-dehydrosuberyl-CoA semialdehyde dehydrogenase|nr:phenylacetic acid degradation bifunctional protein PaaZ [Steroidobacteraceae bacterium]